MAAAAHRAIGRGNPLVGVLGHESESWFALFWAGLNLFYLVAALRGWLISRLGHRGSFCDQLYFVAVFVSKLAGKS